MGGGGGGKDMDFVCECMFKDVHVRVFPKSFVQDCSWLFASAAEKLNQ